MYYIGVYMYNTDNGISHKRHSEWMTTSIEDTCSSPILIL